MELKRLYELAGVAPLTEAKMKEFKLDSIEKDDYEGSEDFENAFSNITQASNYIIEVMKSKGFVAWMKDSKSHIGFKYSEYESALEAAVDLNGSLDMLYDELEKAGER